MSVALVFKFIYNLSNNSSYGTNDCYFSVDIHSITCFLQLLHIHMHKNSSKIVSSYPFGISFDQFHISGRVIFPLFTVFFRLSNIYVTVCRNTLPTVCSSVLLSGHYWTLSKSVTAFFTSAVSSACSIL